MNSEENARRAANARAKVKLIEEQGEYAYHEGNERPGTGVIDTERKRERTKYKISTWPSVSQITSN